MALCLEQTLGHRAHGQNIEAAVEGDAAIDVVRVDYPAAARLPVPWAIRGSEAARRLLRARGRRDVTLFHTQTVSLLAPAAVRGGRYLVSVDATPEQIDTMGQWYRHKQSPRFAEAAKRAWYRKIFAGAAGVVAWSEWAARSLADRYGVRPDRIRVLHPGAREPFFAIERCPAERLPRILFVGGDFERKGGQHLLKAFARLHGRAELVCVTDASVPATPGVRVESGVRPGSDRLLSAFAEADIFCLPTMGDCTSVAIGEAMAAGLPVLTTRVGSNPEIVADGEHGLLVEAGNTNSLFAALDQLVGDGAMRERLGNGARAHAREHMDATQNALAILAFMREAA
jgi:glycosyltransferase involved in cell wall biosynthesis